MQWVIFAFISAVLSGFAVLIGKRTLFRAHAMQYSAVLAFVNMMITLPFLLVADYTSLNFDAIILIYFASLLAAFAFLLAAKSIRHMPVSESAPVFVLGPGITAILAFLLLGERLTGVQASGIIFLIIGLYLLESRNEKNIFEPLKIYFRSKYIHYIILALVLYAVTAVIDRVIVGIFKIPPQTYIALAQLFVAINFLVMLHVFHDGLKDFKIGLQKAGWWILLAGVVTVGYRLAYLQAVKTTFVGLVIAIKRMSALFATIIGGELFHEDRLFRKAIACFVMIVGAILIVL
ncbi:EamA family transporter [Candidatus Woesearchaeota archaeon]|nr:EamA family transporter [Candidatus Woesearchaeota archaeon]